MSDSPSHGKTTEELVSQRLGLGNSRETSVLNLLSVELERVFRELESLLDQSLELSNSSSLVSENLLGVRSSDDDLSSSVGDSDLTSRVTFLGELSSAIMSDGTQGGWKWN